MEVAPPPTDCTQNCQAQNQVRGRFAVLGFPFPVPTASRLTPRFPGTPKQRRRALPPGRAGKHLTSTACAWRAVRGPRGSRRCAPDHLVAVPDVELGRLEGVRLERRLTAAAPPALGLRGQQERRARPPPAQVLAHPQRLDPARLPPTSSRRPRRSARRRRRSAARRAPRARPPPRPRRCARRGVRPGGPRAPRRSRRTRRDSEVASLVREPPDLAGDEREPRLLDQRHLVPPAP